ncbi:MAG TPA: hypothetical protein VF401_01660 [Candidatus Saccharimonadales bacterium]
MSEFDEFVPSDEAAVKFEFQQDPVCDERHAVELYEGSGIAEWASARTGKFGETVLPKLMYVTPDLSHRVAWVRHSGLVEDLDENLVPYTKYHVVCDCAVDAEDSPHPATSTYCDYVDQVLFQRAGELAQERALPLVLSLDEFLKFDEDEMDFRLTAAGQDLAIRAIYNLMDTDV